MSTVDPESTETKLAQFFRITQDLVTQGQRASCMYLPQEPHLKIM